MNKKLQVFVSSTYTDLIEERQSAVQAILDAGHIPAGMELFKAGKSQMKTIQKWIDESDVYMLILGGRYGSIEEESGLSYTELEYRYALSKNMPVFAIILDDNFLFTKATLMGENHIFEKNNIDNYNNFKTLIKSKIVKFTNNIDNLSSIIHAQLNDIFNDTSNILKGWVPCYTFTTNNKINQLVNVLSNKIFIVPVHEASRTQTNIVPQFKKFSALSIFYFSYEIFCVGFRRLSYRKKFNNFIFSNICPYFCSLDIIEKNIKNMYYQS